MAQYRIAELDLSTRCELGLEMFRSIPERPWGRATELARKHNISRTLLYRLRDRVRAAALEALAPRKPGRQPEEKAVGIDPPFLRRAVTVLSMLKGSVRDIQLGLELLFGVSRSIGYISETLQESGAAAAAYNARIRIPLPVLGELDEIFQGRKPCLTIVDGRSFLVLNISPAECRDGTTWGVTLLDLQERGVQFYDLVSDGAKGIHAGVEEAELAVPLRLDLLHLLWKAHQLSQRLERAAHHAIKVAERVRRAEQEHQAAKRRPGRPLKVDMTLAEAEAEDGEASATYDIWDWLLGEVRQALEPIDEAGQLTAPAQARETVETAVELLQELNHREITAFALQLLDHLDDLLSPLVWLEMSLAPWRECLDSQTEALILWAWQHRQTLALEPGDGFPESLQWVVAAFWEALSLFHRSSSLAESFHSWLRPYLQIHRGVPQWLFPLLMLLWNHHTFQRGKREGQSPLELAGVDRVPTLSQVLDRVLRPGSFFDPDSQPEIAPPFRLELLFSFEPAHVLV